MQLVDRPLTCDAVARSSRMSGRPLVARFFGRARPRHDDVDPPLEQRSLPRQTLHIRSVVASNRDQGRRQRPSTLFDARHVPGEVNWVDLDHQLKRERQRVQELGVRGQQLLLLGVVDLRERLLRASDFHDRAVLGLVARAKARHAVLDGGQIQTNLNRATVTIDLSSSGIGSAASPAETWREIDPARGPPQATTPAGRVPVGTSAAAAA